MWVGPFWAGVDRSAHVLHPGPCVNDTIRYRCGMASTGRRLETSRDAAIHEAVLELLRETSYEAMSMDRVAARAGVGKNTIYRRWRGKAELVGDACRTLKGATTFPDQGSLSADLASVAQRVATADDAFDLPLVTGLLTALAGDADLREAFTAGFLSPREAGLREVLERAIAREELPEHTDLELILRAVPALLIYTSITEGRLPDEEVIHRMMTGLLMPLTETRDHE